jgi:hypothetical protein
MACGSIAANLAMSIDPAFKIMATGNDVRIEPTANDGLPQIAAVAEFSITTPVGCAVSCQGSSIRGESGTVSGRAGADASRRSIDK